jgi:hypothetical protein
VRIRVGLVRVWLGLVRISADLDPGF